MGSNNSIILTSNNENTLTATTAGFTLDVSGGLLVTDYGATKSLIKYIADYTSSMTDDRMVPDIGWITNYVDTSIINFNIKYLKEASLGTTFIWTNGIVDVSGGADVNKAYVDGSLSKYIKESSLNVNYFKWSGGYVEPSIASINSLSGLTDVSITGATYNDVIKYSTTYSKWVNKPDLWDVSTDTTTVYLKDPCDNVVLTYIELQENGGTQLFTDMPCSSVNSGSEQSYDMRIDSSSALKIYGIGAINALSETAVIVNTTYFSIGEPTTNGSWRLMIDSSGNLSVQKRILGYWVEKGNFN